MLLLVLVLLLLHLHLVVVLLLLFRTEFDGKSIDARSTSRSYHDHLVVLLPFILSCSYSSSSSCSSSPTFAYLFVVFS